MSRTFKHPALEAHLRKQDACRERGQAAIAYAAGFRTLAAALRAARASSHDDVKGMESWLADNTGREVERDRIERAWGRYLDAPTDADEAPRLRLEAAERAVAEACVARLDAAERRHFAKAAARRTVAARIRAKAAARRNGARK